MRTMNTQKVAGWLGNQGMVEAKDNFLSTFGHMENIDYGGIEGFLYIYYKDFAGDVFLSMQCDVSTTLTFN
jgi:hypothetical protein